MTRLRDVRVPLYSVTIIFVIVTALLLMLGWQNERVNRRSIERHEDSIHRVADAQQDFTAAFRRRCEATNAAFDNYNKAIAVRIRSQVDAAPPERKAQVLRELSALKFPIDDCDAYTADK